MDSKIVKFKNRQWIDLIVRFYVTVKIYFRGEFNPLSANPKKWSNTLKQFVGYCRQIV